MESKIRRIFLSIFLLVQSYIIVALTKEIYVTTPEIFTALNLNSSIGTIEFPLISISEALYDLEEGQSHLVFMSPHKHLMDCLNCTQCSDRCEIVRGGI